MGGVTGEMKGEMKGGMKFAESLYLKGSAPSDGRDGHDSVNTPLLFINTLALSVNTPRLSVNKARLLLNKAALFLNNAALSATDIPLLGMFYSLPGNKVFPAWE
jgi:hypothetical protein